eukprot:628975-Pyramimonas_sp.AAC.1
MGMASEYAGRVTRSVKNLTRARETYSTRRPPAADTFPHNRASNAHAADKFDARAAQRICAWRGGSTAQPPPEGHRRVAIATRGCRAAEGQGRDWRRAESAIRKARARYRDRAILKPPAHIRSWSVTCAEALRRNHHQCEPEGQRNDRKAVILFLVLLAVLLLRVPPPRQPRV